ncbi:bifunctional 5,10-methylenetetrahydrofolate dehydrogenase/5,10-methenyltetrahydrofolate cyclohydrolase [Candidatus Falkowbacteria bacterium]|nr:bifunctional 5,10-methylenetetrahydrofolate dehydrogenase/5,10-methenyltetrahydrofolate cyclohydrolase [Candidatus Falkowbacteria bacterium]
MKNQAKILNGKTLAAKILLDVHKEIVQKKIQPSLAVFLIGDNPASETYVELKKKASLKCGLNFHLYRFEKDTSKKEIFECLDFINNDKDTNAILIQLPLPSHLNETEIIKRINPKKDVDGFHPENLKLLAQKKSYIIPGLGQGIITLLKETKEDFTNKKILIISNSKIFSTPLSSLISQKICNHKKCFCTWTRPLDKNLKQKTLSSDVIIIAAGKPKFLKAGLIKKDSIIIDVGYNRVKKEAVGDVDFKSCSKKAAWISPVPGGVGPMTVAMLLKNTLALHQKQSHET